MLIQEVLRDPRVSAGSSSIKVKSASLMASFTAEDLTDEDISFTRSELLANDWTVVEEASLSVTTSQFVAAYNRAREGTLNIKAFGESDFSKRLYRELFGRDYVG
jgi:hypothetical protein